jgi:hypothetical protein
MAAQHGPHLRDDDAGISSDIEARIGTGEKAFSDQLGGAASVDGDGGDARGSQFHDCERSCGRARIDKPDDRGKLTGAAKSECRLTRFALENGHAAFVERSHKAARGSLVRRHEQATFKR